MDEEAGLSLLVPGATSHSSFLHLCWSGRTLAEIATSARVSSRESEGSLSPPECTRWPDAGADTGSRRFSLNAHARAETLPLFPRKVLRMVSGLVYLLAGTLCATSLF